MTTGRINQITNFEPFKARRTLFSVPSLMRYRSRGLDRFAFRLSLRRATRRASPKSAGVRRDRLSKPPLRSPASASFLYQATAFIAQPPRRLQHHCTAYMSALDVRPTIETRPLLTYIEPNLHTVAVWFFMPFSFFSPCYLTRVKKLPHARHRGIWLPQESLFATSRASKLPHARHRGIWLPQESLFCYLTRVETSSRESSRHLATSRESFLLPHESFQDCANANFCFVYLFFNVKTWFNLDFSFLHVVNYAAMNFDDVWW